MQKKIICNTELIANYLWSLYAEADLWEVNPVKKAETHFIKADLDFLYNNRELIKWGNGRCGLFTYPAFFLQVLEKDYTAHEYISFLDNFKLNVEEGNSEIYQYLNFQTSVHELEYSMNRDTFLEFFEIYKRNIKRYELYIWQAHKEALNEKKEIMDIELNKDDMIGRWEDFLNEDFPSEVFNIILTYSNRRMPSANDISKTRWNFYYQDNLTNFLQHEIGINLLLEKFKVLYEDHELDTEFVRENNVIWLANESFTEYCKGIIFGKRDEWRGEMFGGGNHDFNWFFNYYQEHLILPFKQDYTLFLKETILAYVETHRNRKIERKKCN